MTFDEFMEQIFQSDPQDYGSHLDRMRLFVRELAQGAAEGYWETRFRVVGDTRKGKRRNVWTVLHDQNENFDYFYNERWLVFEPNTSLLISLGYVKEDFENGSYQYFEITQKAFDLLREPAAPPKIFISYKRSESLVLALFIEARLRERGIEGVFLDRQIEGGEEWEALIYERASNSDTLILLVAPQTLESPWVQKEIEWSQENTLARIIPVAHNGFDQAGATGNEVLDRRQWVQLRNDLDPTSYDHLITDILAALGYSTF